nr:unnamed protein product [Callosobruchus chinensis]
MNVQISATEEIERRRLKSYGHVNRMCVSRWPKKILDWKPPFRRKRGRLPEEWEKQMRRICWEETWQTTIGEIKRHGEEDARDGHGSCKKLAIYLYIYKIKSNSKSLLSCQL